MIQKNFFISSILLTTLLLSSCSSYNLVKGTTENIVRPEGWSEITHSNTSKPNYDIVFPQNKVNRIDITISSSDWKLMQDNMTKLFGDPATRANRGPMGGFAPPNFPNASPSPIASNMPNPNASNIPSPNTSSSPNPQRPPREMGGGGKLSFSEEDPIYVSCTFKFENKTWNNVGIRYKGNSSLASSWGRNQKLPFRLDFDEFEDKFESIKNQRFYGFKNLSLSSGFSDNSLIREKIAPDIFRESGVPAAQTAFYRVYIDHGQGSKYFGLYTMVEIPDSPMLQTQFKKDGGNLYKPEGEGAKFKTFDEKSFEKKTNEKTSDWSDIKSVFTALNSSRDNAEQWRSTLEKSFDVDGFLRYLAVNTFIQNWDTYGQMAHNYYLYNDPADKLIHWIPWDHNMSLSSGRGGGGFGGQRGEMQPVNPSSSPSPQSSIPPSGAMMPPPDFMGEQNISGTGITSIDLSKVTDAWPLIRYLMDDPIYKSKYIKNIDDISRNAFNIAKTKDRYQKAHDLIKPYVVGNDGEQEGYTLLQSKDAFEKSIEELNKHLESRHEIAKQLLEQNK